MRKLTKIFYCNAALILLVLLLAGCTDSTNVNAKTDKESISQLEKNRQIEKKRDKTETTKESEETATNNSNDTSTESTQNDNNVSNKKDKVEKNNSNKETNKATSDEETNIDQNENQKNKDTFRTQSDNQDNEIKTNTSEKDQKKAISLVREYMRNTYDDFIEDRDHFLAYDGEINGHIIVRYATLVLGHTSTNGRYAVNINNGKITDVTANLDSFN